MFSKLWPISRQARRSACNFVAKVCVQSVLPCVGFERVSVGRLLKVRVVALNHRQTRYCGLVWRGNRSCVGERRQPNAASVATITHQARYVRRVERALESAVPFARRAVGSQLASSPDELLRWLIPNTTEANRKEFATSVLATFPVRLVMHGALQMNSEPDEFVEPPELAEWRKQQEHALRPEQRQRLQVRAKANLTDDEQRLRQTIAVIRKEAPDIRLDGFHPSILARLDKPHRVLIEVNNRQRCPFGVQVKATRFERLEGTLQDAELSKSARLIEALLKSMAARGSFSRLSMAERLDLVDRMIRDARRLEDELNSEHDALNVTESSQGRVEQPTRKVRRLIWLAKALLLVREYPDWSNARIAQEIGVDPAQLTMKRCPEFHAAAAMARDGQPKRGHVTFDRQSQTSDVEAYDDDGDPAERNWD